MNGTSGNNNGNSPKPPAGLHFLQSLTHMGMAVAHLAFGQTPDDETEEEPAPRRRRRVQSGKRAGSGSCCNGSRRKTKNGEE